jgi:phytoene synthase
VAALETYGEETAAQVLYLQLDAAGVGKEGGGAARGGAAPRGPPAAPASVDAAHHAASHVGVAAAITGLLRGTASHARGLRCYLPADVLAATGCSEEAVFRAAAADLASAPPPPPPLTAAVAEVAAVARGHLAAARGLAGEVAPGAVPYLRQAVGVGRALDALAAAGHNPLHPWVATGGGPSARAGLVWATRWAGWRGRY